MNWLIEWNQNYKLLQGRNVQVHCGHLRFNQWKHWWLLTTGWMTVPKALNSLTFWRFGISKYHQYSIFRNTFQCHWTRIIETTSSRIVNGCQIWKIYIQSFRIISLLLRIINEHESSFLPQSAYQPSVMDCNDGRSIQIISFKFIHYFRLLLIDCLQTP